MLETYDFLDDFTLYIDELYSLGGVLDHICEGAHISAIYQFPVPLVPHEVLGFELTIVAILIEEDPSGDHVQEYIFTSVYVYLTLHFTHILIHCVGATF